MVLALRTSLYCRVCFFFFQAEDGIRDVAVTGVQTCALPIYDLAFRVDLGELAAHEPLDRVDGVVGVDGRLAAGQRAYQPLTGLGEGDDGGGGARTFGVRDDDRLAAFHDGDDRVGRPQVDSYGFWHVSETPPGGVDFGFEMNTDVFFPAFGALKPTSPYAWVDGHLRARPGRPHRGRGRWRAGPAAGFFARRPGRGGAHPRLREGPDSRPHRP